MVQAKTEIEELIYGGLKVQSKVYRIFNALAYSHKKAYVDWIIQAKKEVTRKNRIAKGTVMIGEVKKLK